MHRRTSISILGGAVAPAAYSKRTAATDAGRQLSQHRFARSLASFVAGVLQDLKEAGFIDGWNTAVHESG